ncbi:MAG: hypothetical protein ING37_01290 [Rhodocyclaceae bacterium]|jgi:hypothetical protein|nr:hypothetical protein [Rhodocyclaceae bacterium]
MGEANVKRNFEVKFEASNFMYFQRQLRNAALASHCDSAELLALLADVMSRIADMPQQRRYELLS